MDQTIKNKYSRVMSRVFNDCSFNGKPESCVIRHEIPSSTNIGAKQLTKFKSGHYYELPKVLHDYSPELDGNIKTERLINKKSSIVKPKRTLKSLKVERPNILSTIKPRHSFINLNSKSYMQDKNPEPIIQNREEDLSSFNKRFLTTADTKLRELKNEIDNYREKERLLEFKTRMYKKCGITLDDNGQISNEKAVQTTIDDTATISRRTSQQHNNAGALVPDEQVMSCPIDRYMVDCSRGIDVLNILEDESWTVEPTLRPEDELVLRKLRDLLQSTADDLKELSTELTAARELDSRPKAPTMPLDEEFNQKTRIEEMVNAKFHGHQVNFDHGSAVKTEIQKFNIERKKSINTGIQVDLEKNVTILPRTKNNGKTLQTGQIRVQGQNIPKKSEKSKTQKPYSMNQHNEDCTKINTQIKLHKVPSNSIAYSEISHTYVEPENKIQILRKDLQLQQMPSISIRGELKQQDVIHLDILPTDGDVKKHLISKNNTAVIEVQHNIESSSAFAPKNIKKDKIIQTELLCEDAQGIIQNVQTSRKVLEMSAYESSDCNSSDALNRVSKTKNTRSAYVTSPQSKSSKVCNENNTKHKTKNSQSFSIDDWKKKINAVYGQPSMSNQISFSTKSKKKIGVKSVPPKKSNISHTNERNRTTKLNNSEYVPYSKLTLGGVKLSDIEREVPDVKRKADEPLSPILDKILNETKNALQEKEIITSKVLTTSDENLLREVVEVEKNVNRVIDNNFIKIPEDISKKSNVTSGENSNNRDESSSYDDDFEDVVQTTEHSSSLEKKEYSNKLDSARLKPLNKTSFDKEETYKYETEMKENSDIEDSLNHAKNKTFNLSFKNSVDVFEFIHSVDTQDMAIQSNTTQQLLLKETQTSPRQESATTVTNVNSIHNDLWPSAIDKGEIEKMFKLEKEFIRQLIIDEYSDLVQKDITKPSTSKYLEEKEQHKNFAIIQKNTQTSPAHVKSVMTSPKKTKTRTTSPISLISHVQHHTSPLVDVANHYESSKKLSEEGLQSNNADLDISINLSSPRFNLKLPQNSQEVLSNLQFSGHSQKERSHIISNTVNSSSSVDADKSDSELSSVGEIKSRLHKKIFNHPLIRFSTDSSSSSIYSKSSSEIQSAVGHLKSEGEISMGHL